MISKITIDKVFETALVEEVIGDFIQLKNLAQTLKVLVLLVMKKHQVLWYHQLSKFGKILVVVKVVM